MTLKTPHIFFIALVFTALVAGCDKQENKPESQQETVKQEAMPEATETTCTVENKNKYGPEFADKCFLRGKFKPNSGRRW